MVYEKSQDLTVKGSLLIVIKIYAFFYLNLELEQVLFMLKSAFLKHHRFHLLAELYHWKQKNFSLFKASITHPSIDYTALESLF